MKAADFAKALKALSVAVHQLGAERLAAHINSLAPAFKGKRQVSDLLAQPLSPQPSGYGGAPTLDDLAKDLASISSLIEAVAKPSFVNDWKALVSFFRQNQAMTIREFVAALENAFGGAAAGPTPISGETLVDAYVRRLKETQHDKAEFDRVTLALAAEKAIKQDDMALIASRFAFKTAKSTPRKTSLARIKRRGESSDAAGAKDRAIKGQSAA